MDLNELREKIDEIDIKLIELFLRRMDLSAKIAEYKKQHDIPVYDPAREREIINKLSSNVKEERKSSITALYTLLFELSRAEQEKILNNPEVV